MGASDCSDLAFPKSRPRKLDQQARKNLIVSTDKAEDKLVKARSKGQCEVQVFVRFEGDKAISRRCALRASQIHHQLGGWGRRARGRSALADHKQHVCDRCHSDITGHVLHLQVRGDLPRFGDIYERVK